jgi:(S)-2-hydroxyglutarate dehydrogenase
MQRRKRGSDVMGVVKADFLVVGGGIVGLAVAHRLGEQYRGSKTIVLEKEPHIATHQSGRNSGVIHAGIYYKPGSLKAVNCRRGKLALEAFCTANGIPFERCGKVIVASSVAEVGRLDALYERGKQNGVDCTMIDRDALHRLEPYVKGRQAIHVPETGIVDYKQVCRRLAELIVAAGNEVRIAQPVRQVAAHANECSAQAGDSEYRCTYLLNCAGLYADRVARLCGVQPRAQIVPFRGEYYLLRPEARHLCRGLVYPVPDPQFPFLGVHFTRMIDGSVECGPNAVLALAREGYTKTRIDWHDLGEIVRHPGMRRLALRYWKTGIREMLQSLSKSIYTSALRRLIPAVQQRDLLPRVAGIRAQAILPDGSLVDDFLIEKQQNTIHVINAPSPAATACLTIAEQIVSMVA